MKVALWAVSLIVTGGSVSGSSAGAAARHTTGPESARVIWLKSQRIPAARRAYLTRLLTRAVEGEPIQGAWVKDSRPQTQAVDLCFPGATSSRMAVGCNPVSPRE